ncbi:polymeric immunoglobulin receptor-like isoform X2 [Megalobrama amblycephala]|uniref:polymeric immunoglobulin receptor-like isoform X2 n=1 Tax=Megalobrama amblycephala TaxID=75352 RepID=UPI0020145A99|nr:polymeric immunoglobulin receptor-like isoform X2 [Megalobrama amblycephala]
MILFVLICMLFNISGAQDIRTVSDVSVQEGKSIIIPCWYNHMHVNNVKYLSTGDHWALSKYVEFSDGRNKHKTVSISDNKTSNVLIINMRDIQRRQSGTYWCAIDAPKSLRKSFNLKVTAGISGLYVEDQMLTGFEAGSVTISCHYHLPRKFGIKWCKLGGKCVEEARGTLDGASVEISNDHGVVIVSMSGLKMENTGWYWCSVKELQMPVHIAVSARIETTTTLETTSNQPVSTRSVKSTGTFTSAQTPRSSDGRPLSWLIVLAIVIVSCCAVTVILLCKIKQMQPGNTSVKKLRASDTERTDVDIYERHQAQATPRDDEVIYSTVSPRHL